MVKIEAMEKKIAQRSDWKIEPMPALCKALMIQDLYTTQVFELISLGIIPDSMDEKWFVYYESPWLYLHRSWTGICIYKVQFEFINDHFQIVEAFVNQDPSQYKVTDDEQEVTLLRTLLNSVVERNERNQIRTRRWLF